jgi:hypothetical protein
MCRNRIDILSLPHAWPRAAALLKVLDLGKMIIVCRFRHARAGGHQRFRLKNVFCFYSRLPRQSPAADKLQRCLIAAMRRPANKKYQPHLYLKNQREIWLKFCCCQQVKQGFFLSTTY